MDNMPELSCTTKYVILKGESSRILETTLVINVGLVHINYGYNKFMYISSYQQVL